MKILLTFLGAVLILFGLLTIFLPFPTGLLSLILGIAILASVSATFRKFFKWLRKKFNPLNEAVEGVEKVLPENLRKPLESTDPDDDDDDEPEKASDTDNCRLGPALNKAPTAYRRENTAPPPQRRIRR